MQAIALGRGRSRLDADLAPAGGGGNETPNPPAGLATVLKASQLRGAQAQQADQRRGQPEGIGDRRAARDRHGRHELAVKLADQDAAGRHAGAVELGQPAQSVSGRRQTR